MATFLDKCSLYWDFTTQAGSTGKLHPIKPVVKDLNGDFASVVRASPKTIVGKNGLQTIGNNEPPLSQVNGKWGLFPESGRTNLLQRTEEFNNPYWAKNGLQTITPNTSISPNGTLTAEKIVENTSTGAHRIEVAQNFVSGTTYTLSIFVKKAERSRIRIASANSTTFGINSTFDVDTGVVVQQSTGTGRIEDIGNGWFRCEATGVSNATTGTFVRFDIVDTGTNNSYTGDGTSGIVIWGAQLEAGSFASSYIKNVNTSAGVPRSADVITLTNAQDFIGQDKGFIYAEVDITKLLGNTSRGIVEINTGSINNRIVIACTGVLSNTFRLFIITTGTVRASFDIPFDVGIHKLILRYGEDNRVTTFVNGTKSNTIVATALPSPITNVRIGSDTASENHFNDHILRIGIGKETLTDEEAIALTS